MQTRTAGKASARSRPLFLPAADVKWEPVDPAAPSGLQIVDLWGDHRKGAFGALVRLPAGFAAPLHTHMHDWRIVVVSGTYIQASEGEPEVSLGPGSYLFQPGGAYRHTTRCDAGSDCVFFVESAGRYDLLPVQAVKPRSTTPQGRRRPGVPYRRRRR